MECNINYILVILSLNVLICESEDEKKNAQLTREHFTLASTVAIVTDHGAKELNTHNTNVNLSPKSKTGIQKSWNTNMAILQDFRNKDSRRDTLNGVKHRDDDQAILPLSKTVKDAGAMILNTSRIDTERTYHFLNKTRTFKSNLLKSTHKQMPIISGNLDTFLEQRLFNLKQDNANKNLKTRNAKTEHKKKSTSFLPKFLHLYSEPIQTKREQFNHIANRQLQRTKVRQRRNAEEIPKISKPKIDEKLLQPATTMQPSKVKEIGRTTHKLDNNPIAAFDKKSNDFNSKDNNKNDEIKQVKATEVTDPMVEEVEDRSANIKCSRGSPCFESQLRYGPSDAYWAAASLLTVLLLLTFAVLYTGLLKRRNTFDKFQSPPDEEDNGGVEMENMSAINIQNILQKIPHFAEMSQKLKRPQQARRSKHFQGNKYRRLPNLQELDGDAYVDDDEVSNHQHFV